MSKMFFRAMALAERLMDEGRLQWVMAKSPISGEYERMPVSDNVMDELGLEKGQKVNSILVEAISEASMRELLGHLKKAGERMEQAAQDAEDSALDKDFDFRDMLGDDGDEPTKH